MQRIPFMNRAVYEYVHEGKEVPGKTHLFSSGANLDRSSQKKIANTCKHWTFGFSALTSASI
jgi:hypothetical protein